jgi:TonB family protein
MTFQRSLYISIGIHILLLGSAIAYAQYTRGAFGVYPGPIMVSLVGSGQTSSQREGTKNGREKPSPQRDPVHQTAAAAAQHDMNGFLEKKDQRIKESDDLKGNRGTDSVDSSVGQVSRGGSALVPPEQWQLIQAAIEKVKNYPRMARERGIEGVVRVRFRLSPSGSIERVEVIKSSGHTILDAASVNTVYRAAPMPYVQGWLELPLEYVLK